MLCLLPGASLFAAEDAAAERWYAQVGAYGHFSDDDDYEGPPLFAGIEYHRPDRWLAGLSIFNNSYGQLSQYAYVGKTWHPWRARPGFRVKLSGGIVQGYRGEHYDVLPIRWGGRWGLGVVPAVGYQHGDLGFDVALLSSSGLLFIVGHQF